MILQRIMNDPGRLSVLRNALAQMNQIDAYSAFLEMAANKLYITPLKGQEDAALKASFHNGYVDALADIFFFFERNFKEGKSKPPADFGTLSGLVDSGELTPEEADELRKSRI